MYHTTLHCFPVVVRVFRPRPSFTNRASGEGRDGSDPPFCAAGAARLSVGVAPGVPPGVPPHPRRWWGRSRLKVSLREGSTARPGARLDAPTSGARRDRILRAFLVVGGVSAVAAWTWSGVCPEADPVTVLVRHDTPDGSTAVSSGTTSRRTWPRGSSAYLLAARPGSSSPGWASGLGSARAFPAGHFRSRPTARRSSSARSITRSSSPRARPRKADDPGAGSLYRRGYVRRGRVRQDLGLYAPIRPPTLELAREQS